jgi:hypothetical protein
MSAIEEIFRDRLIEAQILEHDRGRGREKKRPGERSTPILSRPGHH